MRADDGMMQLDIRGVCRRSSPALIGLLSVLALLSGHADAADPTHRSLSEALSSVMARPPGDAVLCERWFLSMAEQIGGRCLPGEDPAVLAELQHSEAVLEAYISANSDNAGEDLAKSKVDLGGRAGYCDQNSLLAFEHYRRLGAPAIRAITDATVSRPGKPTWGEHCYI
jgi:hypothetical protein